MRRNFLAMIAVSIVAFAACSSQPKGPSGPPPLPSSIPALIEILGERFHPNRNAAIAALSAKGEEAVGPLIEAMSKDDLTREGAVHALSGIGAPAVPALTEALKHMDWQVRYGAITALGNIGQDAADSVEALMTLFGASRMNEERIAILHALAKIAPSSPDVLGLVQTSLLVDDLRFHALRVLGEMGTNAVPSISRVLTYLDHENEQTRVEAIGALKGIGPAEGVVEAIARKLRDEQVRVRLAAADALGSFGPSAGAATSALAAALNDSEKDVRQAAARALGEIARESRDAIPALIRALEDSDPQVRREAANALGRFGAAASNAIPALQRVADSDQFEYVRNAASRAIQSIQSTSQPPG